MTGIIAYQILLLNLLYSVDKPPRDIAKCQVLLAYQILLLNLLDLVDKPPRDIAK